MTDFADSPPDLACAIASPSERIREALCERAEGLREFGYRRADAEFLLAAALLGGYFLRRQYLDYVGCRSGGTDTRMLKLAESNGHAVHVAGKGLVRLRGTSLYRAIRCEGSLAGREGAWGVIKKRLLILDYFLEPREGGAWLLTEFDKAGYFDSLGIPAERFPASVRSRGGRPRVFADGFPITAASGDPPVVSFSYAHTGSTDRGMLRHLALHEPLAAALAHRDVACEWVMLSDSPAQFPRLRNAWRRWCESVARDWREREYFALRLDVEKRNWGSLSRDSVEHYADLCSKCTSDGSERRYREWLESGAPPRQPGGDFVEACRYRELLLDRDYALADKVVR